MLQKSEIHDILIWGKTRPEISTSYGELVCTGGVLADTGKLIRIYPVPLRYLDDQKIFVKYQWIKASITKSPKDYRPESYIVDFNGIIVGDKIPPNKGDWSKRAEWILQQQNLYASVEELKTKNKEVHASLGIVKPVEIIKVGFQAVSQDEKSQWQKRYDAATNQLSFGFANDVKRDITPLKEPDFRFRITFRCDDATCNQPHTFSILDWEIDALYFRLREKGDEKGDAAAKVVEKLYEISSKENDFRLFLGNMLAHPQNFTVVGLWYPKKKDDNNSLLFDL